MCKVEDLFYKNGETIEGYLGDNNECAILFVLREPHATEGDTTGFWLKQVVGSNDTKGKRYVNVLGKLAKKLLEKTNGEKSRDELKYYKELLSKCAFINLYPFCGKEYKSENYVETLCALCDPEPEAVPLIQEDKEEYRKIAANRLGIINGLHPRYIVTVCDIYEALKPLKCKTNPEEQPWIFYNQKPFKSFEMESRTKVLAFYHPSYTRIKYEDLDSANISLEADHT